MDELGFEVIRKVKIWLKFSGIRGTRPPSPREVNSRGSSPAVGRFAPSGALSCLPRIIEMILIPLLFGQIPKFFFSGAKDNLRVFGEWV